MNSSLEQSLTAIIESFDGPVCAFDTNFKLISSNSLFRDLVKKTFQLEVSPGYDFFVFENILVPEDVRFAKEMFSRALSGERLRVAKEFNYATFYVHWEFSINPIFLENEVVALTCFATDKTKDTEYALKKAEQLLLQSETNLKTILDHTKSGYLLLSTDLSIVAFTKVSDDWVKQEFNRSLQAGENFISVVPKKYQSLAEQILMVVASGSPYEYTGKYTLESGKTDWYDVRLAPVYNPQNEVTGIVVTASDVTREKNSEAEIKLLNETLEQNVKARTLQLEASNRELEAFTYSISHDLRAPLRNINGFVEILLEDNNPNITEDMKKNLDVISRNSVRMGQLIDSLLELSRLGRSVLVVKEVNMKLLVEEIFDEIKFADKKFSVEVILHHMYPAKGDASLLKQVWKNLIDNAIKYSSSAASPKIEIGSSVNKETVNYFIRDNGIGFDMQYSHKLFGVFQRLHKDSEYTGTGVGLAIVKRIVQRHNGNVGVDSKLNQGTTFYFNLPV
jgi:signal transduction histidine kinase